MVFFWEEAKIFVAVEIEVIICGGGRGWEGRGVGGKYVDSFVYEGVVRKKKFESGIWFFWIF